MSTNANQLITHFVKSKMRTNSDLTTYHSLHGKLNFEETRPLTDLSETSSRTNYELTTTNFLRTYYEQNSFQEGDNTEDSMTESELVTFFDASDRSTPFISALDTN